MFSKRSGALVRIIAWHCVLGIGIGVAALVIVLSVMNGFNLTIRAHMLNAEPHLVVTESLTPTLSQRDKYLKDWRRQLSAKGVGIERLDRFENQDVILRSMDGLFGGAIAKGYDQDSLQALMVRVNAGQRGAGPKDFESIALGPNELIIGGDLARTLGVFAGDEVVLIPPETLLLPKGEAPQFRKYRVKKLLNTLSPDIDGKLILYSLGDSTLPQKKGLSVNSGFEARLDDPYKADLAKAQLTGLGHKAETWMERDTSLFFALKMESLAMTVFLSLAVLITSFSIVIVMVLLLNQKRRDIGLMMVMGLTRSRTRWIFFRVGLMLSGLGIGSGLILGVGVCYLLDRYPVELLPDIYTDSTLPAKLSLRILVFVMLCSSIIATLGSALPVWRYVFKNPSDSLRPQRF